MRFTRLVMLLLTTLLPCSADVVISTLDPSNGAVGPFSLFQSWGQSVTVPNGTNFLKSFSLVVSYANPSRDPNEISDQLYANVMAWDGTKASGPVLYQSSLMTLAQVFGQQKFDFAPNLPVSTGGQYILFLSQLGVVTPSPHRTVRIADAGDAYSGGTLAGSTSTQFSDLTVASWNVTTADDAAFQATFTFVPEPAAGALVGTALAALLLLRRTRRSQR